MFAAVFTLASSEPSARTTTLRRVVRPLGCATRTAAPLKVDATACRVGNCTGLSLGCTPSPRTPTPSPTS